MGEGFACACCRPLLKRVEAPYCMKCGKSLTKQDQEYCQDCRKTPHAYDRGRALFRYDDRMRSSIAAFKYKGRREYKYYYSQEMWRAFAEQIARWQPDVLIPIPLHPARKRKRGYNQAELLALELKKLSGLPVDTGYLARTKSTQPQKQLDQKERRKNMKTAFKILENDVKYKKVLLIDDIYTTGSTMDAAARILKENGVRKVYFLCISIGSGR